MERSEVRQADIGTLSYLYSVLARRDPEFNTAASAAIFVGVGVDPPVADRLHRFGVDVHLIAEPDSPVDRGTCLLGGSMHGRWVPVDVRDHGDVVATIAERARIRDWAAEIGQEPEFSTMHTPGSDSRGVVQFRLDGAEIVAKIGVAEAISGEVRFAREMNALLAKEGHRGLFPEIYGLRLEGGQGVSLMEAGTPMPIAPLFGDPARTTLDDAAVALLEPHLDQLATWYRLTARTRRPTVADYLYRERYHVLREHPAFVGTFRSLFDGRDPAEVLDVPVELPGGLVVPGYGEAVTWLDEVAADLLPDHGSAVHGDIYAANMLLRADGSPMMIDPRTVWEGRDRQDVGYGDPVYDLSTLLHGVLPMAAILRAVQTGATAELFADRPRLTGGGLDLSSLRLPVKFPPAVLALQARMLETLPPTGEPAWRTRTRLHIGAATSLTGWLKYERSLPTPQAWLATFAYVAWYLRQAGLAWEGRDQDGDPNT